MLQSVISDEFGITPTVFYDYVVSSCKAFLTIFVDASLYFNYTCRVTLIFTVCNKFGRWYSFISFIFIMFPLLFYWKGYLAILNFKVFNSKFLRSNFILTYICLPFSRIQLFCVSCYVLPNIIYIFLFFFLT